MARTKKKEKPSFTDDELRAIHVELKTLAWEKTNFHNERKEAVRKLDEFFAGDLAHLEGKNK